MPIKANGEHAGTMTYPLPSGEQYEIVAGDYRAVAVEVGGGLRELWYAGRRLLDGYPPDALADAGRGQVLAPWPNRLRDGRWSWQGRQLQLPLSEPATGNAIHGLVRWSGWSVRERAADRVVLGHRLHPQPGYPFVLDLRVQYVVASDDGLTVELTATNPGREAAPVALGMHPYLAAPDGGLVDACSLTVPAKTRVLVDERSIPAGTEAVDGTPYDLQASRPLGDLALDTAYTDLAADSDGRVRVVLAAGDRTATELWSDAPARWVQIFTGDKLAPDRRRRSVAVEPMTAPANALASGEGLSVLNPQQSLVLRWGVRAR
jgi:aldose 1-epimerase